MTTTRDTNGHKFYLRRRYRKAAIGWVGEVIWNPSWVAANLDGLRPRIVWQGWSLTERQMRRRIAKQLRKRIWPGEWKVRGDV